MFLFGHFTLSPIQPTGHFTALIYCPGTVLFIIAQTQVGVLWRSHDLVLSTVGAPWRTLFKSSLNNLTKGQFIIFYTVSES